jgi:site-specific DNA recombinase
VTKVRAAAIYARISSDVDGSGLGVARQLEDCRKLAESLGWPVAEEYVDNDLSAYSASAGRGMSGCWPICATVSGTR